MKKGPLNFLGRKSQSLFDTNVDINKDMGNLELALASAAIPESGTAKVRSRPTVKHFMSSDSVHGFAVPTPKVPVLPPFSEPKINGTGTTTKIPNGSMLSIPDMIEGEILIPPPPRSAPPPPPPSSSAPPPPSFVPPSPQFDPSVHHPPPVAPPKPQSSEYRSDLDLASLKPPPMAPPKPPSETSSFKGSISSLEVQDIPDCPKFTPPPPPVVKTPPVLAKAQKTAPPKPVRMSSIPNMEIQAPPIDSNPTPSSFNPQNTAKLYNVQKSTVLAGKSDREKGAQSILLLEDSSGNTVGVVNGKNAQSGVPPTKPARRNSSATQLKDDQLDITQAPTQPVKVEAEIHPQNIPPEVPTPIKASPKIEKKIPDVRQVMTPVPSPGRSRRYSPVVSRHLNTRTVDGSVKKEASTSPFALLMAAKEREKQRTTLSQQNSNSEEPVSSVIQPSVEKPNSFTVIPRDSTPDSPSATKAESYSKPELSSSTSRLDAHVRDVESGEDLTFIPPPPEFANSDTEDEPPVPPNHPAPASITNFSQPSQPALISTVPPPAKTVLPPITNCPPPSHPAPVLPKVPAKLVLPNPITNVPPPSHPAPAPPSKSSLTSSSPPVNNGPLISTKPKPPGAPPKAPGPPPNIQPQSKSLVQAKPPQPPTQAPASVAASQATLLSILQKKMLEMDPKISSVKEVETNGDDWNTPLSDDEATSPPAAYNPIKSRNATLPVQSRGLDMKELESKAARKAQEIKSQSSTGASGKQQYGMTFTVRPGSKQPITPVIKDSSA